MSSPLSDYFRGVGVKRLTSVEIAPQTSNQHEFNGINEFKAILGTEKRKFTTKFIYLTDDVEKLLEDDGFMTWYNARENHPSRTEYRLYYSGNEVLTAASSGDLVVVGKTAENNIAVIIAPQHSTSEKQLLWLFGMEEAGTKFTIKDFTGDKQDIGYAGRYILSSLGMEPEETAPDYLEELLMRYGMSFPSTGVFSAYARSTVKDVSPVEEPDNTLMAWLEREELLFKTLEKVIVKEQLKKGFGNDGTDVEEFIKLSLSIQNRRKARAGFSFENHLAVLFTVNKVHYSHGAVTERNNKPDFIFPGIKYYHDNTFDTGLLTMLGLKTSAKDRWRQVLSEAAKIPGKHLITLEPAISRNQTEEMKANKLQLIIPSPLFPTYTAQQQDNLMTLKGFIELINGKQNQYSSTPLLF
jgi:hypothetical protein